MLHNITPDRVVVCYRDYDSESLDVALYYKESHHIPLENLVALPCVSDQTITESQYNTQIKAPLIAAIDALDNPTDSSGEVFPSSGAHINHQIWVVVLGFNVPNFYIDSYGETIPVASRVQRLKLEYTGKALNHTFNRQIFDYFTNEDIDRFYITAVLDGPDAASVKKMIDTGIVAQNTDVVTGRFYLDPYGLSSTTEQLAYRDLLVNFEYDGLPYLGINTSITTETTRDPTFRNFQGDSFYWGWYTPYCPKSIFASQNENRIFMYNADNESAANIRLSSMSDSLPWCNTGLGISPAYASMAGATEDPGEDAYLLPEPFFRALHLGATIGEAFMSSCKYLDWKIILIGDPLLSVTFPLEPPPDPTGPASSPPAGDVPGIVDGSLLQSDQVGQTVKNYLEESIAYRERSYQIISQAADRVIDSESELENTYLLNPLLQWRDDLARNTSSLFSRIATKWFSFVTETSRSDIDLWLSNNSQLITTALSELVASYANTAVDSDYLAPSGGYWSFTFYYIHPLTTAEKVHFQIQVLSYLNGTVVMDISSLESSSGWQYESRPNTFITMSDGFYSSNSGRRVRYNATVGNYLSSLDIYRIRWRPLHENGSPISGYITMDNLLIIKSGDWPGFDVLSPDDTVVFYADSFGLALHAGEVAKTIINDVPGLVRDASTRSMVVYQPTTTQVNKGYNPLKRRDELVAAARDLIVSLEWSAYGRNYYVNAFQGLYTYILQVYEQTIDEYLTERGLKVDATFAVVSASLGQTISPGNINTNTG